MNFTKQVQKLENFLEQEFKNNVKLIVVSSDVLLYKNYKITKTKYGWTLSYLNGDKVYDFRLKACAAIGAKYHSANSLQKFNEIKALDLGYWTNFIDSTLFKNRIETSTDRDKKELYYCRWDVTRQRALRYKQEITQMFKHTF